MTTIRVNQKLPDEFAHSLRQLADERPHYLDGVLALARVNGWTLEALAEPLGITRQRVRQRIARVDLDDVILPSIDIPTPPSRKPPQRKPPQRRLRLSPEAVEELRRLHRGASTVNGATPADDPCRAMSVALTEAIQALIDKGVAIVEIADALGVGANTIRFRLGRHGFRSLPPTMQQYSYKGQQAQHILALKEFCKRDHPMSGENLHITSRGDRVCRACDRIRTAAYRERKRLALGGAA